MVLRHTRKSHIRPSKPAAIAVCLSVLALCLLTSLGCDPARQHKVLTFLFDGVPPLRYVDDGTGVLVIGRTYEHAARKECTACHGDSLKTKSRFGGISMAGGVPTPDVCYKCHEDRTAEYEFLHGPVAVGDCLFCHEPHESSHKYLLKQGVPALCYRCHNE